MLIFMLIHVLVFSSYSCLSLFSSVLPLLIFYSHSSFLSSFSVPIPPSPHFLFPFSFLSSYSHSPIHICLLSLLVPISHHAMNSAGILLYAFTSSVAGYVSARLYRKMNGDNWVWNVILTASMFAGKL